VSRLAPLQLAFLGLALACAKPAPLPAAAPEPFSGERAFAQLERLVALGPRVAGTPAAASAHTLVRDELAALGLEVHEDAFSWRPAPEAEEVALVNLWADVPGPEAGLYAVATPLDTAPGDAPIPGANEGGSGAALLLELARSLHERPLPYTVRLFFLDGELRDETNAFLGSKRAYFQLRDAGAFEQLRLLLYVHQVGDRELEVRRDRLSDRKLRDFFFIAAQRTGHAGAFPANAPYEEIDLGHGVFARNRFPHVVALADLRYGGPDVPGSHWRTPADDLANCSAESLGAVGAVVRAGLEVVAERQRAIDRASGTATRRTEGEP
jgi:hypothetical protein